MEKLNLLRLYNLATDYGCKPSDFISFETELAMWHLNEVCLFIGRRAEKNINEGKDAFAGFDNGIASKLKQGFRSAKQFVKRKLKIKPNGTW